MVKAKRNPVFCLRETFLHEVNECDNEQMSGNELVPFKSTNEGVGEGKSL